MFLFNHCFEFHYKDDILTSDSYEDVFVQEKTCYGYNSLFRCVDHWCQTIQFGQVTVTPYHFITPIFPYIFFWPSLILRLTLSSLQMLSIFFLLYRFKKKQTLNVTGKNKRVIHRKCLARSWFQEMMSFFKFYDISNSSNIKMFILCIGIIIYTPVTGSSKSVINWRWYNVRVTYIMADLRNSSYVEVI